MQFLIDKHKPIYQDISQAQLFLEPFMISLIGISPTNTGSAVFGKSKATMPS